MEIRIMKNILDKNQNKADEVRKLLADKKVVMINLISSPGAGKTTLLDCTCEALGKKLRMGIIEGDIATDRDAQRLKKHNIPIVVINTEGGCHLDSHSISKALDAFELEGLDLIFVENVGNLICPSEFDLGETCKVAITSTPEGDDKPAKYPLVFHEAKAAVLNKTDLLPYLSFNLRSFVSDLNSVNPVIPLFEISCTGGEGLSGWYDWVMEQVRSR